MKESLLYVRQTCIKPHECFACIYLVLLWPQQGSLIEPSEIALEQLSLLPRLHPQWFELRTKGIILQVHQCCPQKLPLVAVLEADMG